MNENLKPKKWQYGDTFAMEIKNISPAFNGRYLIFNKVQSINEKQKTLSVFRILITPNKSVPQSVEELNKLEYIKIWPVLYENCFWGTGPGIDVSKYSFNPDEYGYLWQYQFFLYVKREKDVPKNLEFIGNFNLEAPKEEYIPFTEYNIPYCFEVNELTEYAIDRYLEYNKKNSELFDEEHSKSSHKFAEELNKKIDAVLNGTHPILEEIKKEKRRKRDHLEKL